MPATDRQPHARPLSADLIASLVRSLNPASGSADPSGVRYRDQHSNDIAEVVLSDGRTLMVKRGRYAWTAERFRGSRIAAGLVNDLTTLIAPAPLPIPDSLGDDLLEVYWRVELPTLQEVWPSLSEHGRSGALRSLGELLSRLHRVSVSGHGAICDAHEGSTSLSGFLNRDLGERLLPAVHDCWAEGAEIVEILLDIVPAIGGRVADSRATLLHNDVHMGNVLCAPAEDGFRCVGLIDLEAAHGGPPEADLANLQVLHGPLFAQPLAGDWFSRVLVGYGRPLDAEIMSFYRAYHLANLGFYSALVGHNEHAEQVASAARREVDLWRA